MADPVYGKEGENTFKTDKNIGKVEEYAYPTGNILNPNTYSLTITTEDAINPGLITIYRRGATAFGIPFGGTEEIGTIERGTNKFTPNSNASEEETIHFNQQQAIKNVRENAEKVISSSLDESVLSVERDAIVQETVYGTKPSEDILQQIAEQELKQTQK